MADLRFYNAATNIMARPEREKEAGQRVQPLSEIVLMLARTDWKATATGPRSEIGIEVVRFEATPEQLHELGNALSDAADEAEGFWEDEADALKKPVKESMERQTDFLRRQIEEINSRHKKEVERLLSDDLAAHVTAFEFPWKNPPVGSEATIFLTREANDRGGEDSWRITRRVPELKPEIWCDVNGWTVWSPSDWPIPLWTFRKAIEQLRGFGIDLGPGGAS